MLRFPDREWQWPFSANIPTENSGQIFHAFLTPFNLEGTIWHLELLRYESNPSTFSANYLSQKYAVERCTGSR